MNLFAREQTDALGEALELTTQRRSLIRRLAQQAAARALLAESRRALTAAQSDLERLQVPD